MTTTSRWISAAVISTTLPMLAGTMPARGAPASTTVAMACRASTPIGSQYATTPSAVVNATAPSHVALNGIYTERIMPPALTVPTSLGGFSVVHARDLRLRMRVYGGAIILSARLEGGHSPGATAAITGQTITLDAPAVAPAGTDVGLPDLVIDVLATGPRGSTIVTGVPGTSYDDWSGQATARMHAFFDFDVHASCFVQPMGAVLSSTTIG
ncbi:MAG: cyclase [Acidimicrobiales bacterium]|nr:cyclase [Acidimicrobiales bacterium]